MGNGKHLILDLYGCDPDVLDDYAELQDALETALLMSNAKILQVIGEKFKPYRDENGQIIGGKEAYGEEYNAIHCPKPIRNRFTSVLFYSATNR